MFNLFNHSFISANNLPNSVKRVQFLVLVLGRQPLGILVISFLKLRFSFK